MKSVRLWFVIWFLAPFLPFAFTFRSFWNYITIKQTYDFCLIRAHLRNKKDVSIEQLCVRFIFFGLCLCSFYLHSVIISSNRSVFSFDSFSCFSSSVWLGLDGPDDALSTELGDELIGWAASGDEIVDDNSMDGFRCTSAYSTGGDAIGKLICSLASIWETVNYL